MKLKEPMGLLEYQELTLKGKAYCEAYSDYWNSMAVDAVLMPVAPHAAVIPDKFYHLGKYFLFFWKHVMANSSYRFRLYRVN